MGEKLKKGAKVLADSAEIAEQVAISTQNKTVKQGANVLATAAKVAKVAADNTDNATKFEIILDGLFDKFKLSHMKAAQDFLGDDYDKIRKGVKAAIKISESEGQEEQAIEDLKKMVLLLATKLIEGLVAKGIGGPLVSTIVYCLAYLTIEYWNTVYTNRLKTADQDGELSDWISNRDNKKIMTRGRNNSVEIEDGLKEELLSLTIESIERGDEDIIKSQEQYLSETYPVLDDGKNDDEERFSNIEKRLDNLEKSVAQLEKELD